MIANQFKQLCILDPISQSLVSECSCQAKNVFLLYGSTRVTCPVNDSDNQHYFFISQTCFHCQYCCISLCVQLVTKLRKISLKADFGIFCQLILPPPEFQKSLKTLLQVSTPPKVNICPIKSAKILPCPLPLELNNTSCQA